MFLLPPGRADAQRELTPLLGQHTSEYTPIYHYVEPLGTLKKLCLQKQRPRALSSGLIVFVITLGLPAAQFVKTPVVA